MISITDKRDRTCALNGLATTGGDAKGAVRLVVMERAHRLSVIDVERLVREGFMARRASETFAMILSFELPIGRVNCCLLYGLITPSTLKTLYQLSGLVKERKESP